MKIPIPEGFEIPAETEEGGNFTVLAECKANPDGSITLVSIDGAMLPEDKEEKGPEIEIEVGPASDGPEAFMQRARDSGIQMRG